MKKQHWIAVAGVALIAGSSAAQTATFDTWPEGAIGREFADGGVRFFNYDNRLDPPPSMMVAEWADATLGGLEGFTSPNALAFGGYVPGEHAGFGRFGALEFTTDSIANFVDVNVFTFGSSNLDKTLTLEAYLDEQLAATDQITLPGDFVPQQLTLAISGINFDSLRLVAGPTVDDVVFILLDTITVTTEGLSLDPPDPGMAGMNNTLRAHGGTSGERVYFVYGLRSGSTSVPGCPGVTVEIDNPQIAGRDRADANGDAELTVFVPGSASGRRVFLQAVERATCSVSNLVDHTFQ